MKSIFQAYQKVLQKSTAVEEVVQEAVQVVTETTVPEHLQHIPESWDHHAHVSDETREKMHEALGGKSFVHFPLDTASSEADPDVLEHLTKHGYEVKDYNAGIATIKKQVGDPSRGIPLRTKHVEEKIGSVLERTNASPEVKTSFMNDPARAASKSGSGHHVVISTSPLAVAGMTTGTSWRDQSCMNMEGGGHRHKLKDDSEHGTHVAFLVPHDDHTAFNFGEPSKPIARIALKPFHSQESNDTIFRPENKTYGVDSTAFTAAVGKWASEKYPARHGETYEKNEHVYDDTANNVYRTVTKEEVEDKIARGQQIAGHRETIDSHLIDHAIKYAGEKFKDTPADHAFALAKIAEAGSLTSSHVAKIVKAGRDIGEDHPHVRSLLVGSLMQNHGDKVPTSMMKSFYDKYKIATNAMLMHPKLPDEVLDKIDPMQYSFVRRSLLKQKHMDRFTDLVSKGAPVGTALDGVKDHLSAENIHTLIDSENALHAHGDALINTKNFNRDHHEKMLEASGKATLYSTKALGKKLVKTSKFATVEDTERVPGNQMYFHLLDNPHLSDEEGKKLKDKFMTNATGGNPDAKPTRWSSGSLGFDGMLSVPERLSKHMTNDDYSKLAEHNYRTEFDNKQHSNKFLDASFERAKTLDKKISDLKDAGYKDIEPEMRDAKSKLHSHMENYSHNIDNHVNNHVIDYDAGKIGDWREHEKTLNRLSGSDTHHTSIDSLKHYGTPENEAGREDHEHHEDNFVDIKKQLVGVGEYTKRVA